MWTSSSLCFKWSAWQQTSFQPLFVVASGETIDYGPRTNLFVHRMPRPFGLDIPAPRLGTVETAYQRAAGAPPLPGKLDAAGTLAEPMDWWPDTVPSVTRWGAYRFRVGAPFPAFEFHQHGWQTADGTNHNSSEGAVEFARFPLLGYLVVPFRPVWPGFLLNWLAWTALVWLVYRLVSDRVGLHSAKRRRKRIERDACISCGYALAGLHQCPECGSITPPASSSA